MPDCVSDVKKVGTDATTPSHRLVRNPLALCAPEESLPIRFCV